LKGGKSGLKSLQNRLGGSMQKKMWAASFAEDSGEEKDYDFVDEPPVEDL